VGLTMTSPRGIFRPSFVLGACCEPAAKAERLRLVNVPQFIEVGEIRMQVGCRPSFQQTKRHEAPFWLPR